EETPLFLASREGGFETVKVLLNQYANRDMTDHMDRLPRDIALERRHHDIVELLDTYKIASPATAVHLGVTSPNNHSGIVSVGGYMHPIKQKAKSRKNKNAPVKDPGPSSPHNGTTGVPVISVKSNSRKKKADGESAASRKKNQQQQLQQMPLSLVSSQNQTQVRHQSTSDASPMSTISPGGYSIDLHHSPQAYETSPPRYENSLNGGRHLLDDFQVMAGHYSSPSLMDHANVENLLTDWTIPQYKHQLPPQKQQHQLQQPCGGGLVATLQNGHLASSGGGSSPNLQTGLVGGGSSAGIMGSVGHAPPSSMKGKNLAMSPTHIQALQQHAQQRAAHGSPHHRANDFPASFQLDGTTQLPGPQTVAQLFSGSMQHKMVQPQQQHLHQQQQQQTIQQQPQQLQQQGGYTLTLEQYPTPPSHNSQHITDSPPHQHNTFSSFRPDHLLTPSPDSPGQWSSSSPHSAQSDWSEGISSPAPAITGVPNPLRNKRLQEHAYF
ncbi:unnamed protein product, partial [Candidula unifasciata]